MDKKLLVYVDSEACAEIVMRYVYYQVKNTDAQVLILTNVEHDAGHALLTLNRRLLDELHNRAKEITRKAQEILKSLDNKIVSNCFIREGLASDAILHELENNDNVAMCIVMGGGTILKHEGITTTLLKISKKELQIPFLVLPDKMTDSQMKYLNFVGDKDK